MINRFEHLKHEVCNCLRWKSMFYQSEPDPTVPPSHDASYWCVMTQRLLGPDGQAATPEQCQPGRGCFKEGF